MRNDIWQKRIPTILGLLFITISVVLTSFLVKNTAVFKGRAAPSIVPQNLRITNISDTSFTVSYITEDTTIGSLSFGTETQMGNSSIDDRDQPEGIIKPYKVHYITVRDLKPNQKYFFEVISGQETFLDNGKPFEVNTAQSIVNPPPQQPVSGKIISPTGDQITEAIVYLTTLNSQILSVLVKPDGSYILPLNSILNENLTFYVFLTENDKLQLMVSSPNFQSQILLLAKQTNPVPLITLSKDYDFTISLSPTDIASNAASLKFPTLPVSKKASNNIEIQVPSKNEGFSDPRPVFRGTALPGEKVKISIQSKETIEQEVITSANGKWTFRPPRELSPGSHNIIITTKDAFGVIRTITQSFTVFVSGSQVAEAATPSATPKITLTPTTTPTQMPTLTLTPTLIPTLTPTSTPIPIITETPTPIPPIFGTPEPVITITPQPTSPPQPGSEATIAIGIVGIVLTITGGLLFLLSRGSISF